MAADHQRSDTVHSTTSSHRSPSAPPLAPNLALPGWYTVTEISLAELALLTCSVRRTCSLRACSLVCCYGTCNGHMQPLQLQKTACDVLQYTNSYTGWPKIVNYRTLSISLLNIAQFSQFFSPVDSVRNLLLIGMRTTPTMSLHYLVKHKYPKTNNIIQQKV